MVLLAGCRAPAPTPTPQPSPTATLAPTPGPSPTAAPTSPPTPAPSAQQVSIEGFAFSPQTITVARGTTVVLTNKDAVPHTVTSDDSVFDSGSLAQGATYSYIFDQSGTFTYYCAFHPYMKGTVIVQ
ncbi:MAG: cupredoxin family copper-binding protein [Chloroflexi bacterium]|nr:cupredoxin family copper-binding protein [Chloroflexota bacterium]